MNRILLLLAVSIAIPTLLPAESKTPTGLEMRLVVQEAAPSTEDKIFIHQIPGKGRVREVLHVEKAPVLQQKSVRSAKVLEIAVRDHFDYQIEVTFNEGGTDRLAEVTRENLGRQMAILIEGQVVLAPIINSAILEGKVLITGGFTEKEATDLAAKINATSKTGR